LRVYTLRAIFRLIMGTKVSIGTLGRIDTSEDIHYKGNPVARRVNAKPKGLLKERQPGRRKEYVHT
jgi:hypothetical protein